MILITGAAGKTGQAVSSALARLGVPTRFLVRSRQQAETLPLSRNSEVVMGDLRESSDLEKALDGVKIVYFICPNMAPDELLIGQKLISLAKKKHVCKFVYHSVLHPQVEAMPHHWQKARMEEEIFTSGMDFTILQPSAYMQNILQYWISIFNEGIYPIPYATSARISIVDLEDVAEAAANVLTQDHHSAATYELAGPQPLSQDEVAQILASTLGRSVVAGYLERQQWSEKAQKAGLSDYQRLTLIKMFEYYENYGLVGNSNSLEMLLKHPANSFESFITRHIKSNQPHQG